MYAKSILAAERDESLVSPMEPIVQELPATQGPALRLPWHVRVLLRQSRRGLPAPACAAAVERAIEMPSAADGVTLIADHYRPLIAGPQPAVLVRSPYGRGFPGDYLYGALFARQGFHVILQSCRGTGGSGGDFEPFVHEAADAQASVAWLRGQDWFSGELGTVGASYLGFTQWAMAAQAPPELRAMAVQVGSDDFYGFLYPGGAFALQAALTGTAAMLSMEHGFPRFLLAALRLLRHLRRVERSLPLIDAYPAAFGRRAPFFEQWLAHPDHEDPFWVTRRAAVDPSLVPPASLLTGWWDVCLDPTLDLYRRLRDAGREVRLTVGPWNHASGFNDDLPLVFGEALGWLQAHLSGDRSGLSAQPVRIHISEIGGRGAWREMTDWPPPGSRAELWQLSGDGTLTSGSAELAAGSSAAAAISSFRYDPASPTPSVGGPAMDSRSAGPRHNDQLEARADVLTFTSAALDEPVEVIGPDERDGAPVRCRAPDQGADLGRRAPAVRPQYRHRRADADRHPAGSG